MKKNENATPDKGKLLLRSYIMSLLSLMLCVTMLLGTTYAWFTSEVSTPTNEILVGSLKVDLVKVVESGQISLSGENAPALFGSGSFRWEPGATQIETVQVVNEGDLSFDYSLYFSNAAATEEMAANLKSVSKYIEVYVTTDSDLAAATENAQQMKETWVRVGTLHDVIYNGIKLNSGSYDAVGQQAGATVATVTIALHMPGTVTEKDVNMGTQAPGLSLRMIATQKVAETDDFGKDYDQSAPMDLEVDTYQEFKDAVEAGESFSLTADITIPADTPLTIAKGKNVTIDTNGHTISSTSVISTSNRILFTVEGTLTLLGERVETKDENGNVTVSYKGGVTYKHTGSDMGLGYMSTILNITNGGVVQLDGVTLINEGGTYMNYVAHLYNSGNVSLYMKNAKLKAQYITVRLFNNDYGMNNVVAEKTTLEGKYSLWVHHYIGDLDSTKHSDEAIKNRLNINIYNGGNVLTGPMLFGYETHEYHVHDKATFDTAMSKAATRIVLEADIDVGSTQYTVDGENQVTIDLNGHNLTGAYTGTEHYAMFAIDEEASLTVNGEGKISAVTESKESNRSLAIFQNSGKLTINGGTYTLSNVKNGYTWIIATIVDNRTKSATCKTELTINGGDFSVTGDAINLFRNYPQQGGTAKLIINDGTFRADGDKETYIWNQEASTYLGELYFNGGTYDEKVVYEDYNGHSDIYIAEGVTIAAYSGNN